MALSGTALTSFLVATSFAAGLNVYATVAALGLLSRAGLLALPPSLDILRDSPVIVAALVLFAVEFVADKIPFFDLIWNALQTFVRVPVAALFAFRATAHLPLEAQLLSGVLGGTIALAAHTGKLAARTAVTPSPEPFSNIGLSVGEDVAAVSLVWLAVHRPYLAAAIALGGIALVAVFLRPAVRVLRAWFGRRRRETRTRDLPR
jgi:Domain of unknown function (DUF4126)